MLDAALLQMRERVLRAQLAALGPAGCRRTTVAHVHGDEHALGPVRRDDAAQQPLVAQRGRADNHACGAGIQRARDRRCRAQSPAVLHGDLERARDPLELSEVDGLAAARAVEIDHVQEARSRLCPRTRRVQRVLVVDGARLEVPLHEAHCAAAEDVDGGVEPHRPACPPTWLRAGERLQMLAKLASRRRPAAEDFSG